MKKIIITGLGGVGPQIIHYRPNMKMFEPTLKDNTIINEVIEPFNKTMYTDFIPVQLTRQQRRKLNRKNKLK